MTKVQRINPDVKTNIIDAIHHSVVMAYNPETASISTRMHIGPDDGIYIQLRPTSIRNIDENTLQAVRILSVAPRFDTLKRSDIRLLKQYTPTTNPLKYGLRAVRKLFNNGAMTRRYADNSGIARDIYGLYAIALGRVGKKHPRAEFNQAEIIRIAAFLRGGHEH